MSWHHQLVHRAARLYWRIRKPRTLGVRAVVLDEKDRVALVRHTYTDQWYLPGGGVKKGESFETAIHRELKEEIALSNARISIRPMRATCHEPPPRWKRLAKLRRTVRCLLVCRAICGEPVPTSPD